MPSELDSNIITHRLPMVYLYLWLDHGELTSSKNDGVLRRENILLYGCAPPVKQRWKALTGTNAPAVGSERSDNVDRSRSRITLRLRFADGRICQTNERRSVN